MVEQLRIASVLMASLVIGGCGGGGGLSADNAASGGADKPAVQTKSGAPRGDSVQLTVDPCSLVTLAEAQKALGATLSPRDASAKTADLCSYERVGGGVHVELLQPLFCKMLISELDNLGVLDKGTVPVNVGDGGLQVRGTGGVQFLSHGGCVNVGGESASGPMSDSAALELAKTAARRVTG